MPTNKIDGVFLIPTVLDTAASTYALAPCLNYSIIFEQELKI